MTTEPKRFFTGQPCEAGHIAERYRSTGQCVVCTGERYKRLAAERKAIWNESRRRKYAEDAERRAAINERNKRDHHANAERRNAQKRQRWATDADYRNACLADAAARRALRDPEATRAYFRRHYYGVTPEQFEAMLTEQGGGCKICRAIEPLSVDHCHAKGDVRGLLCRRCNSGLGMFRDNPDFLRAAIEYLGGPSNEPGNIL